MKTLIAFTTLVLVLSGCMTTPLVETTEPWEGHYFSFDELKTKTNGQQLKEKQSLWLLSNTTLKRLLKDAGAR